MRILKVAVPAAIVLAGIAISTVPGYGTQEFSKALGNKPCTTCHMKIGTKDAMHKDPNLNATGKCFKEQKDKTALTDACKNAK